jgi:hypothetical protein
VTFPPEEEIPYDLAKDAKNNNIHESRLYGEDNELKELIAFGYLIWNAISCITPEIGATRSVLPSCGTPTSGEFAYSPPHADLLGIIYPCLKRDS